MSAFHPDRNDIFKDIILRGSRELNNFQLIEWVNCLTRKDNFTALHYASFRGNIEICDLLIERGADY